jgi:hypothetical protein
MSGNDFGPKGENVGILGKVSNAATTECLIIRRMSEHELLEYILANPEYLTDSYYRIFGDAIRGRARELIGEPK